MTEDEIVARAHREVGLRQASADEQPVGGRWTWALAALVLAVVLTFFAVPAPLPHKLLVAMGGVCSLRPGHSYFAGGLQLPLEARMLGIYGGFLLSFTLLLLAGRLRSRRFGGLGVRVVLLIMFGSMVLDGVNSTFAEVGWPRLYDPTNLVRLMTGLLSGIALAPLVTWLAGSLVLPRARLREERVVRGLGELLAPIMLGGVFAALVLDGRAALYYPLALIAVGGILTALTAVALLIVLVARGQAGRDARPPLIRTSLSLALLLAFAILGVTAVARWSLAGAM